ncbi:hypothetical protein TPHA_0B04380 [Tetrapisispora phaffii CBS 4417]|uniref:DNA polymerase epsilon catalytic subunit n=1 Tax=Tetrapisispora phaffii (strain ATCC 24235 / CBS 4417 / NBRC 1672 / NRRL Y-8282 / UCD 70-5) TaxID=1071381 RepID=G8BQ26_TETPH|nr:hypothetical protein TPHA_0B04380 [Tetrapisispora phaffii CBS 4417]CCE62107.1 hypothetical protein TPHA_0B04380 [Tetrapisispora phaffii CBS 4417]
MSNSNNSSYKGSTTARFVKNPGGANSQRNGFALSAQQLLQSGKVDEIDTMMGFERYIPPQFSGSIKNTKLQNIPGRVGWLVNMHPTVLSQDSIYSSSGSNSNVGVAGVDFYFLDEEGGSFKSSVVYDPYFFITVTDDSRINDVEEFLKKYLESCLKNISVLIKDDLAKDNHLIGLKKTLIKLSFVNSNQLFEARNLLRPILRDNANNRMQRNIYNQNNNNTAVEAQKVIEDIREYDVPYHVRVSIDKDIRVGKWYKITSQGFFEHTDKVAFADPVVLAFDIETTKPPLKFPDAQLDQIMMISYMIDGDGYLITNREIISEDIEDFEYTPKQEYQGLFTIFNEVDEVGLLNRFFEHIREAKPTVISTFNGDFFDWPFVETRSKIHGINMYDEIGFAADAEGEYKSSYCAHMDCYRWVKRDSYLPQGSQGLKAVTQAKLGYNPIELDPELMTPYAYEKPQILSEYSVSDAVATYYLYMKYVHPFIFSLCTIIPLNPDETLRKGTGTLCEMLLMVQAYQNEIILPNKHTDPIERFYDGHLLESETYVGGHVESLEAGVFRSDIPNKFTIDPNTVENLMEELTGAMKFSIEVECNSKIEDVTNFEEIKADIANKLTDMKLNPQRDELPLIYHVDVASMYPNIMITNRLQPDSIKSERDCASCDFNRPSKKCDRRLKWAWRGNFFPTKMDEYNMIKRALQNETFKNKNKMSKKPFLTFDELSYTEQVEQIKKRLTDYSKKVYHKTKVSEIIERESIVCQRENPFYIDTVRSFRDRRYEFKGLAKTWKGKMSSLDKDDFHGKEEAKKMIVLYDSLQLAHKVILNSFYGYVMRKGSRWYSMEMAGITCLTGATIIQMARSIVDGIGRPLELDTDGIWCIIPKSFPENYTFTLRNGKKLFMSYPCSMLNYKVHQQFSNEQYQTLIDPIKKKYKVQKENSIFFEVDGPYKAMVLPTSKEEGKGIKKRYAVFNDDGSLAELKGFELKRRGELQLIKNFQSDIFKVFLEGDTLENCYKSVADVANRWLDILDTRGSMLEDEDLIELICENRSMSKTLKEYEGQKSTSITTAKRLGEFLGEEIVRDKGLQCKYIISSKPINAPVTERAIPVAIFSSDIQIKRTYLRRWLQDPTLENFDPRSIIDWDYYRERVASVVQKIITIPAALQDVTNPVPRVEHPDWLKKKISTKTEKAKQSSLTRFFSKSNDNLEHRKVNDIEDMFKDTNDELIEKFKVGKVMSRKFGGKRKRIQDKNENTAEENMVLPAEFPAIEDNYVGWLKYQKIKWKIQQKDRNRRNELFGNNNSSSGRNMLSSMIRKQAESYANSTWEIIQYKKGDQPGELEVYVLINQKIQVLNFKIPKTLFIKFKNEEIPINKIKKCTVEKSNAMLPNNHFLNEGKNGSLFKLTLPEKIYEAESEDPTSILNDEGVMGIFESTITSSERAIIELGSTVSFSSNAMGALGRGLQKGFDMKSLSMSDNNRYLSSLPPGISYILHLVSDIGYEFFTVYKSWDKTVRILTLKPSNHAQVLQPATIEQLYKTAYNKKKDDHYNHYRSINLTKDLNFEQFSYTDITKVYKKLSQILSDIKDEKGLQFLMLIQSPYIMKLLNFVKYLNQVPLIELASNELSLPQLNWQTILSKIIVSNLVSSGSSLHTLITLSHYSNIPICNLKLHEMNFIIDVLYARKLKNEGIVLWWNDKTPLPDYGGTQKEFDLNTSWIMNDLKFLEINNPDVYDNVTLELSINNLTVNTVLTSAVISSIDGSDLAEVNSLMINNNNENGTGSSFVQDSFSTGSLSVLRSVLKSWWDQALKGDVSADLLVNSFVSWVQNPDSKLFDGTLRYHVNNLTKKSLLQLINEFVSLGSSVVYADRNKLFIKTSKTSPENCYAYGQYIVKAIRSSSSFCYLDLSVERYWDILIWMDKFNFSGLACNEITDSETQEMSAYSQWQIKDFLPAIYQPEFDDWIMIILDSMVKSKDQYYESKAGTQRLTQLPIVKDRNNDDDETGPLENYTKMFYQTLLQRVQKLFRNQQEFILDPQYKNDYIFPVVPGSHLNMKNPLLEFVKFICQVMLLSTKTTLEVRELRKELLKIFEIREFEKKSEFQNPSSSLVINCFLCEHCYHITDIDICKANIETVFSCERCEKPLAKQLFEDHLIQMLVSDFEAYYTQDPRCVKCRRVKKDLMSEHCPCSGNWINTISQAELLQKVKIYNQVANHYNFIRLTSAITEVVQ